MKMDTTLHLDVERWSYELNNDFDLLSASNRAKLERDGLSDYFEQNKLWLQAISRTGDLPSGIEDEMCRIGTHFDGGKFSSVSLRKLESLSRSVIDNYLWREHFSPIIFSDNYHLSRSSDGNPKLKNEDSAMCYKALLTSSRQELQLFVTNPGMPYFKSNADLLALLEDLPLDFPVDSDELGYFSQSFDGVKGSFLLLAAHLKISEYHEEQLSKAIKAFPLNLISIDMRCVSQTLEKQKSEKSILFEGVCVFDPSKINIHIRNAR